MKPGPGTAAYKAYYQGKKAAASGVSNNPYLHGRYEIMKLWYDKGYAEGSAASAFEAKADTYSKATAYTNTNHNNTNTN